VQERNLSQRGGFTLIELLIVIAIIAILALIAIPNFLEAQVRARVSRVHSDMRALGTAVEAYTVDNQRAPIGGDEGCLTPPKLKLWTDPTRDLAYKQFTTPIAYMTTIPLDPFDDPATGEYNLVSGARKFFKFYEYQTTPFAQNDTPSGNAYDLCKAFRVGYMWYLRSPGPAQTIGTPYMGDMVYDGNPAMLYDPTNGTKSIGNIFRTNKGVLTGAELANKH
jgi:type II secretion system protein G